MGFIDDDSMQETVSIMKMNRIAGINKSASCCMESINLLHIALLVVR